MVHATREPAGSLVSVLLLVLTIALLPCRILYSQSSDRPQATATQAMGVPAGPGRCSVDIGGRVGSGSGVTVWIGPDCSVVPVKADPPPRPRPQASASKTASETLRVPEPTKTPSVEGTALFLSREMRHALKENAPDFRSWWSRHYLPSVMREYRLSAASAPFAVLADFNKDGVVDAALHGHDRERDLVIALLSKGDAFEVIPIERGDASSMPVGLRDDAILGEEPFGLSKYLTHVPPTRLSSPKEKAPLALDKDAFKVSQFGQASKVYYYSEGKFQSYLLDDRPAAP